MIDGFLTIDGNHTKLYILLAEFLHYICPKKLQQVNTRYEMQETFSWSDMALILQKWDFKQLQLHGWLPIVFSFIAVVSK